MRPRSSLPDPDLPLSLAAGMNGFWKRGWSHGYQSSRRSRANTRTNSKKPLGVLPIARLEYLRVGLPETFIADTGRLVIASHVRCCRGSYRMAIPAQWRLGDVHLSGHNGLRWCSLALNKRLDPFEEMEAYQTARSVFTRAWQLS